MGDVLYTGTPEKCRELMGQLKSGELTEGDVKQLLIENVNAALPYMDADMRELAKRTLSKVDALTEAEFAELPIYAADEV